MSDCKRCAEEILQSLAGEPAVSNLVAGERIDSVRPEIYFETGCSRVAVEVVKPSHSVDEIEVRTRKLVRHGLHVLWVVPTSDLRWLGEGGGDVCRVKLRHEFLHAMYFGRIYFWQEGGALWAAHFDRVYETYYTGGARLVKTKRRANWLGNVLHVGRDFRPSKETFTWWISETTAWRSSHRRIDASVTAGFENCYDTHPT